MEDKKENICYECSRPFLTEDENVEICSECWQKIVGSTLKCEGETIDED